jgi:hypothetical protein
MLEMLLAAALAWNVEHRAIEPSGCDTEFLTQPVRYRFNYEQDIQPLWAKRCSNCHVDHAGNPLGGLDLDPPGSYSNIVNAPSVADPILLVRPRDPRASLMFRKINCEVPGPLQNSPRMPLARPALSASEQALIYDWIAAGAPETNDTLFRSGFSPLRQ